MAEIPAICHNTTLASMRKSYFYEQDPESPSGMPWDRLKQIGRDMKHGPGNSKPIFAKRFIQKSRFDIRQAAKHPNCPSASYLVQKLGMLGKN